MKRHLPILFLALILGLALAASAGTRDLQSQGVKLTNPQTEQAFPIVSRPTHRSSLDENIYFENWSTGTLDGWTPIDLTAFPSTWHIDTWHAFGGAGHSWWVGDTAAGLNGYNDAQYFVLDSPPITLPATTPALNFWHRFACETPTGATAPYDGWDGMNLRISTDNGTTWAVIPNTAVTPAYTRQSLYSFGFQHNEGANIPGWAGQDTTWHLETANLATWAGQTVKLRWAFASDPAEHTTPANGWFGWEFDNVRVYRTGATDTVFTDNCDAVGQWTTRSMLAVGGNLWRIATDVTSPAESHILVCNNAGTNLYNRNMNTVIESPLMDVRGHGNGQLLCDVQLTGVVQCATGFPDCDYWGMEVSIDSGRNWCKVSNPTCDPNGTNYVYSDCPANWASFNETYSDVMDFSALLGNVLKFRFTFQSNNDTLVAVGPKFDGFTLDYTAGFAHDLTCSSAEVRYPVMADRPTKVIGYFENVGQNDENDVNAWFRLAGGNSRFLGRLSLTAAQQMTLDTTVTIATAGRTWVKAYSTLGGDQQLANDTSLCDNIVVQPAGAVPEIGYDNRSLMYRINHATGSGPMVRFTPQADSTVSGPFDITSVMAQFSVAQGADYDCRLHVYADNSGSIGAQLLDSVITVHATECTDTVPTVWKTINTSMLSNFRARNGAFWVWFEITNTGATDRWPQIIGDNAEDWAEIHTYTYTGSGTPTQSQFFYRLHATVQNALAAPDATGTVPTRWSLEQNYPNPFNPTTEIRYSVPRADHVTLKVFNLMGQEVATLINGQVAPGSYTARFDASQLPSGVYVYRLESSSFSSAHKMLLMK